MIGKMRKANKKNLFIQFLIGGVVGAAGGYAAITHGDHLDLADAHVPGLVLAGLLLILGVAIIGATLTRSGIAEMVGGELEPGEDLGPEVRSLRWQGVVGALAGTELAILSLSGEVLTGPGRSLLLAMLALVLAAQSWFNIRLWRSGDELFRQVIVEAMLIGFLAFQFLLFLWVVGARFELVADPAALDIYVLMLVLYLTGSMIASIRRGYAQPST